ncbi:hypothetical protein BJX76DRAFT_352770 [Aspergillus varians]
MSPHLYIVFYRPCYGNYQHWALQLESNKDGIIFKVVGQHPKFERNILEVRPERSGSFVRKLYVSMLSNSNIKRVKSAARQVPVDNETSKWDCQDYVLEILDRLQDDYILDENNKDYQEARKELRTKRGAII